MRTTRIEADERGLFRRGLRGLHGFFHYNKEINLCNLRNPRLIFYSLACVHDNCADKTSAILDFPSL